MEYLVIDMTDSIPKDTSPTPNDKKANNFQGVVSVQVKYSLSMTNLTMCWSVVMFMRLLCL